MMFRIVCFVLYALILVPQSMAQGEISAPADGAIVDKVPLHTYDDLIDYIRVTEKRDTVDLDPSRFAAFEDVDVFGITYLSDGLKVKGFLLKPKGEGTYPAVIYNRGGSLEWGSLTHFIASIRAKGERVVEATVAGILDDIEGLRHASLPTPQTYEALFGSYVGTYTITPEDTVAITEEAGRLVYRRGEGRRVALTAESELTFHVSELGRLTFLPDEHGAVGGFYLRWMGQEILAKKNR